MPRKPVELDKEQFEKLCELQCTQKEICSWFDITDKTLTRWCKRTYGMGFSDVFEIKRGKGKIALRRYQFQQAKTSASMAIWLGKQWLGYGINTQRLVVTGERVPYEKVEYDSIEKKLPSFREIFFLLLPFLFIVAGSISFFRRKKYEKKNKK